MKKHVPTLHLICNAHLDPVWQWRWEEGASEAVSTFRVAAGLLAENPRLIFCHNEAWLYRWVERLDPGLFAEIRRLVKAGRWAVSGGWHLQPDVNMPGVESLIRQIAEGRAYFRDRFGSVPRAAYNFDSFGHGAGLPQVLKRAGYGMYIHMRPQPAELELPSDLYRWRGADGSEILACRIEVGLYHTEYDNIERKILDGVALALERNRDVPVFWGIGDHGGGPTRRDLAAIEALAADERRVRIVHSTPDRFYAAVRAAGRSAPLVEGDLQRCFTGCYTSLARLKRRAVAGLGLLVQTEALRAASWWTLGQAYPAAKMSKAWRAHLFNDFHDILPGSCVEAAESDALDLYGKAGLEARGLRLEAAAAFARTRENGAEIPLTVLNANPALKRVPVEAEFMIEHRPKWTGRWRARLFDAAGAEVAAQEEQPEPLLPFNGWRRKIVFMASPPPVGAAFYEVRAEEGEPPPPAPPETARGELVFRAPGWPAADAAGRPRPWAAKEGLEIGLDRETGLCARFGAGGENALAGPLPLPVVVDDAGDSWGAECWSYRDGLEVFRPAGRARIVERGPVRTILESLWTCRRSRIVLQTIVYPSWPVVEFRLRVQWNEERKRLKLALPTVFKTAGPLCEVPGAAVVRPADGQEHVHGRWCLAQGKGRAGRSALGIVHAGLHGLDVLDGEIRLSVLRGSAYCHERNFEIGPERARKFADQGVHEVRLAVTAGRPDDVLRVCPGLADWLAAPPAVYAHLPFGRGGNEAGRSGRPAVPAPEPRPGLVRLSASNLRLLACKPSWDGQALIVRVQESAGRPTRARLEIGRPARSPRPPWTAAAAFAPFEIKTFRVERSGRLREVALIDER